MAFKKIEHMDYYEILNLRRNASQDEIKRAYHLGKSTYKRDSLAHYGLLSERERWMMLRKIEEAYQNLNDPEKRRLYDMKTLQKKTERGKRIFFRKSTQKLEIEDAGEKKSLWRKIRYILFSRRIKK